MPHVLILPSWYPLDDGDAGATGGAGSVEGVLFREQAEALAERGVCVGIVYAHVYKLTAWRRRVARLWRGSRRRTGSAAEGGAAAPIPTVRSEGMSWLPMFPRLNRWILVQRGLHLFKIYVDAHGMPDVLHVQAMYRAGHLARAIKRRYGVPYVITEHHSMYALGRLGAADRRAYGRVAAGAAARLAVSPALCARLEALFGGAGESMGERTGGGWAPIANSVSARFLEYPLEEEEPGAGAFEFLSVSHLQENKGVEVLVEAFARAFPGEDGPGGEAPVLTIAGDGPLRARLERQAAASGAGERIRFVGRLSREEVARAMAACQAYVLPSRYETFGMVVVEALALGRPVVATACGGPEWILRPEEGVLVPVGDAEAMATALVAMRREAARYDAHALRAGCRARFSDDVVAARLLEIYREAASAR